jgi:predicted enzyme related to lactoylglutathione lyase
MTDSYAEITDIIIDCADPERLAAFWCDLLERPIKGQKGPYVWLTRSAGGMGLGFQKVEEPKRCKNRVHIDISGPDIGEIKDHVEALGGRTLDGYEAGGFLVMADPEGNEFSVVPEDLSFDASGRADYLDRLNLGGS